MDARPKSDADDASSVAGAEPETGEEKKTPRRRTRYYSKGKAKTADAAPVASDAPKAEIFVPEPVKADPAPREEASAPASSPAPPEPASHHPPAGQRHGPEAGDGGVFQ